MPYVFNPARSLTVADLRRAAGRSRVSGSIAGRGGARGMGAAPCPSLQQLQGIVDPTDPCQSQVSANVTANVGGFCLTPWFPWIGNQVTGGGTSPVCAPVFSVPSPWPQILTAGLVGFLVLKALR